MLVKIPPIQHHEDHACGKFHRRRRIDAKRLAASVPVENDLFVLYLHAAVLALAVAALIEAIAVGADLDVVLFGTPGADVDEVLFVEGLLAGGEEEEGKNGKGKLDLHSFYFARKIKASRALKPDMPVKTPEYRVLKFSFPLKDR